MYKTISLITLLIVSLHALNSRTYHNSIMSHEDDDTIISPECCQSSGGQVCGSSDVQCCDKTAGCMFKYIFFYQTCAGNSLAVNCSGTCRSSCSKKGGIICQSGVSQAVSTPLCCKQQNCDTSSFIGANCSQPIDITGCVELNPIQKLIG